MIDKAVTPVTSHPGLIDQQSGEYVLWRDMDGPIYHGVYLGFCTVSKPPTSVNVLQGSLKELYLKYRRLGSANRSASLKLIQHGVLISLFEEGLLKDEIFFNFSTVTFVEAVKFATVKSSSERKPKALFLLVDESKGIVSEKNAFVLDKSFHFLVSASHPPLLACVVRRPKGVKALDCHVLALDTIENALHVTSLIMSAQTPPGFDNKGGPGVPEVDLKGDNQFNRGSRGDVIRTDHGDYSFYRGHQNYEGPPHSHGGVLPQNIPTQNIHFGSGDNVVSGGAGVRSSTNFQRFSQGQQQPQPHFPTGNEEGMVYSYYEQPHPGALIAGPMQKRHGSAEYRRQGSFEEIRNNVVDGGISAEADRSLGIYRNDDSRLTNRHSTGGYLEQMPKAHYVINDDPRQFQRNSNPPPVHSGGGGGGGGIGIGPGGGGINPRFMQPSSQFSPHTEHLDGPVFSASNLESRSRERNPVKEDNTNEQYSGGKPVAKVPPHLKGVKVLPSDFRMVKLKHKTESKRSDSSEEVYDNNNEIMNKYKVLQEHERTKEETVEQQSRYHTPSNGNPNFNNDFDKEDTIKNIHLRPGQNNLHEYSGARNRFSAPVYADSIPSWGEGQQSHSAYNMGGGQYPGDDDSRVKDAEIANMFSHMRFHGNNHNDLRRQPQRDDFEEGLGYLP